MPWTYLVWMWCGFVATGLLYFDWRAGFTLWTGLAVHAVGFFTLIPPNYILNHIIGHVLLGLMLGAVVCTGRQPRDVRRLPAMLAAEQLLLAVTGAYLSDIIGLAWLFALRIFALPLTMFGVIALAQRHRRAKDEARLLVQERR